MRTKIENGFLVRDDLRSRSWPTRDADPIVYAMPSRPAVPEPETRQPPEYRTRSPDGPVQLTDYFGRPIDIPESREYQARREPPTGLSTQEIGRYDSNQPPSFGVFLGPRDGEKRHLRRLAAAYEADNARRLGLRTRDEGRTFQEVCGFDELDGAGVSEGFDEPNETTYQLRRAEPGYTLHKEVPGPQQQQDHGCGCWVRPRVRGQANDGARSDTGRQMADIRAWQAQLEKHNKGRVF